MDFHDEYTITGNEMRRRVRDLLGALVMEFIPEQNRFYKDYTVTWNNVCSVFLYDLLTRGKLSGFVQNSEKLYKLMTRNKLIERIMWSNGDTMVIKSRDPEILDGYRKIQGEVTGNTLGDFWMALMEAVRTNGHFSEYTNSVYTDFMITSWDILSSRNGLKNISGTVLDDILRKTTTSEEKIMRIEDELSFYEGYDIYVDIVFQLTGEWIYWKWITSRELWGDLSFMSNMGYTPVIRGDVWYRGSVVGVEKISDPAVPENNVYRYYAEVDGAWLATFCTGVNDELNMYLHGEPVLRGEKALCAKLERTEDKRLAKTFYGVTTHPVIMNSWIVG